MQNSPAALIEWVAVSNGIDLQTSTVIAEFSAYVLTLKHIETILSNDLVNFSLDSLIAIRAAFLEIRNNCNALLKRNIDQRTRAYIMRIRQPLAEALAQINKAAYIFDQTIQDARTHITMYDEFQKALAICVNITLDINILLDGWEVSE